MKGKLLSREEILNLKDGIKVWVEDMDEEFESSVHTIKEDKLRDKDDYWVYKDDNSLMIYEWLEEPESEQTITKTEKETNTYNKTYKGSEVLVMIEDGKLKDDDVIVDKDGTQTKVKDIKDKDLGLPYYYFMDYAPFTIKPKPVKFMEAVNSGKLFNVEHKFLSCVRGDMELNEFFSIISDLGINDTDIRDIINNGKYYLSY